MYKTEIKRGRKQQNEEIREGAEVWEERNRFRQK